MKTKKFLGGLALGALLGGVLGLFVSPDKGTKNRAKFKKVTKTLTDTLIKEVANAKKLGKKEYEAIVENIVKKYSKDDLLTTEAWKGISDELKMRWSDIQKEAGKRVKANKKKVPAKKK
jgi:gas vesicle protein